MTMQLSRTTKIILPGGAGLVGQNLLLRLKQRGFTNLVVLDKHQTNIDILQSLHPNVVCECVDLAEHGEWQKHFNSAGAVVMLQAQIGGMVYDDFVRNNITASKNILEVIKMHKVPRLVHISSSVVKSVADDFYSRTKKNQEKMVLDSGIICPILRPTLMFGWFDRKHLGWLARFMRKVPIFPIPGHGRYMRQPLFAGDFCEIIIACLEKNNLNGTYNISGHEKIDYIDMIHAIKKVTNAKTQIIKIPYSIFHMLLSIWGWFDKNPPFTPPQLSALVADDEFEIINWPEIFAVATTPFQTAIEETFTHPDYSHIALEF